jgi:transcriptional regulator with XRE-family HTH domain
LSVSAKANERPAIAANLRAARLAAGFETVSDAARHIGIPVPTAVAHEGGARSFRRPKLEQLRKYAIAYGTTIDALEGGTIVAPPAPADIPRHLVSLKLAAYLGGATITVELPTSYKVGDEVTLLGRVTGIFRKL